MKRIKKGDNVIVIAGKSKGMKGVVLKVLESSVVVSGVNLVKKCIKPNPQKQIEGGIVSKEAAMHISNVALVNPATQKADRVGFKFITVTGSDTLKKVRYFKSNGEPVETLA